MNKLGRLLILSIKKEVLEPLKLAQSEFVIDSFATNLSAIFERLNVNFTGTATMSFARHTAATMLQQVAKQNKSKFDKSVELATGVNLGSIIATEGLEDLMHLSEVENVKLITTIPEQYLSQVETVVTNGVKSGARYSTIEKQILGIKGINGKLAGRIKTIARNEVSTINSQMTLRRSASLGITEGIFRTSKDKRVRASHKELNGVKYKLSKGAWSKIAQKWIIPGITDINCRCTYSPVIEIDDHNAKKKKKISEEVSKSELERIEEEELTLKKRELELINFERELSAIEKKIGIVHDSKFSIDISKQDLKTRSQKIIVKNAELNKKEKELEKRRKEIVKWVPKLSEGELKIVKIENKIKNNKSEELHVVNTEGKIILSKKGDKKRITTSPQDITKMRNNIVTHNHPFEEGSEGRKRGDGGSFSPGDIDLLFESNMRELRAVSQKFSHSLKIESFGIKMPKNPAAKVQVVWEKNAEIELNKFRKESGKPAAVLTEADREVWHRIMESTAKKFKWLSYKRKKI